MNHRKHSKWKMTTFCMKETDAFDALDVWHAPFDPFTRWRTMISLFSLIDRKPRNIFKLNTFQL